MTKLRFKDENDNFIPVVQDVKVNGESIFNGSTVNLDMIMVPKPPILTKGKIYSLKIVNGTMLWYEDEVDYDDSYITDTILVFSPISDTDVEEETLNVSDFSSPGVSGHTLILN